MLRMIPLIVAALGTMALAAEPIPRESEVFESHAVGPVHVYLPAGKPSRVAVVLSGDGGWKPNEASGRTAAALAGRGVVAVGVDVNQVFSVMSAPGGGPFDLAGLLHTLAKEASGRYGGGDEALLSGYSAGATLAYAAFAQSGPQRFSGLVTQGFCPDQETVNPVGTATGATIGYRVPKVPGWVYRPAPLPGAWAVIEGDREHHCPGGRVSSFLSRSPTAKLWTLPRMDHSFEPAANWAGALSDALTFGGVPAAAR